MTNIVDKIKLVVIEKTGVEEAQLTASADFEADLNIHSLEIVEILDKLEDDFNITFSKEDGLRIKTVGDLTRLVSEKVEE
ncbi:MAG: acyl carrier protein [candidate division WWE3 bacterium]|nr:acyl carrier protein [candidate division WWE3 bacterium]